MASYIVIGVRKKQMEFNKMLLIAITKEKMNIPRFLVFINWLMYNMIKKTSKAMKNHISLNPIYKMNEIK